MGGDIDSLPFLQATLLVHLHDAANAKDPFQRKRKIFTCIQTHDIHVYCCFKLLLPQHQSMEALWASPKSCSSRNLVKFE